MQAGMVGLGRMGLNMVRRMINAGHDIVAFDISATAREQAEAAGARCTPSLEEIPDHLEGRRLVWVMLPAGAVTDDAVQRLLGRLQAGDVLVDGGNANWKDSQARAALCAARGIEFLDAGTSGGIWGLENGYSLMVGGGEGAFTFARPVLESLAPPGGLAHVGPAGAGHFVKMVHNGIEYAMMQAYAEGFELLASREDFDFDVEQVANLWQNGSVIRSWLLELLSSAFAKDPGLDSLKAWVDDSGEGRWTIQAALESAVPAPTITMALYERFRSRQDNSFANRVLAALRNEFGGHAVRREPGNHGQP